MENSQDLFFQHSMEEDAELDSLHSQDIEINTVEDEEKPLSPVLSGSSVRKLIRGKKNNKRKNCKARLIKKLEASQKQKDSSNNIPRFPEDSFSVSQTDALFDRFEKLEQIEKFRDNVYSALISNSKHHDDSTFKKPLLPPPITINKTKLYHKNHLTSICVSQTKLPSVVVHSNIKRDKPEDCSSDATVTNTLNSVEMPKLLQKVHISYDVSFQTAGGKTIKLSDDQINKHSQLFEDILTYNSVQDGNTRPKKYNYIHKNVDPWKDRPQEFKTEIVKSYCDKKEHTNDLLSCSSEFKQPLKSNSENFTNKQVNTNCVDGKNIFGDENFDDLSFQGNFGGFTKATELKNLIVKNENTTKEKFVINTDLKVVDKKFIDEPSKNIFNDENLDNLNLLGCFGRFQKVTEVRELTVKNKNARETECIVDTDRVANIFKGEHFVDLKLHNSIKNKNIFGDENFEDLKLKSSYGGFKKLSEVKDFVKINKIPAENAENGSTSISETEIINNCKTLHSSKGIGHQNKSGNFPKYFDQELEPAKKTISKTDKIPATSTLKRSYQNIFADEDLSDLLPPNNNMRFTNFSSFQKLAPPKPKRPRNICADNLSDLKPLQNDFKNCKSSTVTGINTLKKDPRNIFEGEDFSDLKCFNGSFSKTNVSSKFPLVRKESKALSENVKVDDNFSITQEISKSDISNTQINSLVDDFLKNNASSTFEAPLKEVNLLVELSHGIVENFKGFNEEDKLISGIISEFFANISSDLKKKFNISIEKKEPCNIFNITDLNKTLEQIKQICSNSCKINSSITPNCKESKRKVSDENEVLLLQSKKQKILNPNSFENNTPKRLNSYNSEGSLLNSKHRTRKRLGTPFSPTIQVSQAKLERARKLFEEELSPKTFSTSTPLRSNVETISFNQNNFSPIGKNTVTPVRKTNSFSNVSNSLSRSSVIERTVIRKPLETNCSENSSIINVENSSRFLLETPTKGKMKDWIRELEIQRHALEVKLRFINRKQSFLNTQKSLLEENNQGHNKPKPGVLYNTKSSKSFRMGLREFVGTNQRPGDENSSRNQFLCLINPHNAEKVHFMLEDRNQVFIATKDEAVIIPNSQGAVGIVEIENSFKVMPGVDPTLIPKKWIRNHFKWVVWKLASYERMFPKKFEGVFSLENVIQQLKYRYDREIDKVERSALRRIMEKDDVPQKRMILCVTDILKIDAIKYEIELTDGWYSIRTTVDQPLANQIIKGKIKVGIKLITCGAELLNCDGCHPLEVSDMVRLKINFNSTRRARWDAKLGYQKDGSPFILPIDSFVEDGGVIGCIRFYVSRVYLVKYMEKIENGNVWRNKKAEERRAQEWQSERLKVLEKIQESVQKSYSILNDCKSDRSYSRISEIEDPQTLYETISSCNDPEALLESLTESQKSSLRTYQLNKSVEHQYEIEKQIKSRVSELQCRDVTALLKFKIVDVMGKDDKQYCFHVWRPTDGHMQLFRENHIFTAYNVSYSQRWGLSSNIKTQFKPDKKSEDDRFVRFRRKVTLIEHLKELHNLDEFDTIGLVISVKVEDAVQQLWLSDGQKNLLLVNVYEDQRDILIFDNLKPGQIVTGCNLVFSECNSESSIATGNHSTIFSSYPKYKHLQEALDEFEKTISKDLDHYVKDCNAIIMGILNSHNSLIKSE